MSTTPTAVLEMLIDLPPTQLVVEHEVLMAAYRQNGNGEVMWRKGYHTKIFSKIKENHILQIWFDQNLEKFHFYKLLRLKISEKEKSDRSGAHLRYSLC